MLRISRVAVDVETWRLQSIETYIVRLALDQKKNVFGLTGGKGAADAGHSTLRARPASGLYFL